MTQHTRGRFHYPLPQVKDAQLLLRDATDTIDFTVAHLVLQNYVADYINVPCFGKSVKWTCSEPVRYMNCLHDQKSLHVLMSGTCYNGSPALPVLSNCNPHS